MSVAPILHQSHKHEAPARDGGWFALAGAAGWCQHGVAISQSVRNAGWPKRHVPERAVQPDVAMIHQPAMGIKNDSVVALGNDSRFVLSSACDTFSDGHVTCERDHVAGAAMCQIDAQGVAPLRRQVGCRLPETERPSCFRRVVCLQRNPQTLLDSHRTCCQMVCTLRAVLIIRACQN